MFEIYWMIIRIQNLAHGLISNRSFQRSQIHLQHSLTIERILLADLQHWSYGWVEELYWRR